MVGIKWGFYLFYKKLWDFKIKLECKLECLGVKSWGMKEKWSVIEKDWHSEILVKLTNVLFT